MKNKKVALTRFGVSMPNTLLETFDTLLAMEGLPNRSIALRHLVRNFIAASYWLDGGSSEICGSITILYEHHSNDILDELTILQHDYRELIICATHVHITHETCLECIIVKGTASKLKTIETALKKLKGIKSVNSAMSFV
jgi:CopG family nickel-responsive transcriptional regulator